ncbi:hypothetical protein [Staphylococcus phage SAP6]|nr:hypothetical protein [Staphylococcus phage StAP1]WAW12153.1 hypothetical protein [Staphylococcus phage SAP6]
MEDPQRLGLDEPSKTPNYWEKKNPYPIKSRNDK